MHREKHLLDRIGGWIDGGAIVNIFPKIMLKSFKLGEKGLVKNNIMVTYFSGRSSSLLEMITLDVVV